MCESVKRDASNSNRMHMNDEERKGPFKFEGDEREWSQLEKKRLLPTLDFTLPPCTAVSSLSRGPLSLSPHYCICMSFLSSLIQTNIIV